MHSNFNRIINRFNIHKSHLFFLTVLIGCSFFITSTNTWAQSIDTLKVNPQNLSKEQLKALYDLKRDEDIRQRLNEEESEELEENITEIKKKKPVTLKSISDTTNKAELPIFGNEIFNNPNSTFAPVANRPTPVNYILGPGDKLEIDVSGNSVVTFKPTVAPDGSITLREFGKVYVGGRTIESATEIIKSKLRANRFAIGNGTDVDVILTNIRTIQVTILGQVRTPGDYSVPSTTSVFNALYESGGITPNGSFRSVKVIRNSEEVAHIDMYDYLLRGDLSRNIILEDGDIIMVTEYRVRVSIEGEVKRPAYYEVLPGESMKDVIYFAGGFTDYAYRFNIKAVQLTDKQQRIKDVFKNEFDTYIPLKGDKYLVEKILNKYENRVSIAGSVNRPGEYELVDGLTLRELILKADGLKEDAYMERGYITRQKSDNTLEVIPFYVKSVVEGTVEEIALKKEDAIQISSIFDFREQFTVTVNGKVRISGTYPYYEGMSVQDLILRGGGFADGANMMEVEIARRVKNSDLRSKSAKTAQIIKVMVDKDLKLADSKIQLEPFDIVSIFALPGYIKPQLVTIEGEVMQPGTYAMMTKDDRISDLIKRANGFTAYAYVKGSSLKRKDYVVTESDKEKQEQKLKQFQLKQKEATDGKDPLELEDSIIRNDFVGIDLEDIMKSPKVDKDLILLDGDIINVPRQLQTVRISGQVYAPKAVVFEKNKSLLYYINGSGGFKEEALRRGVNVVYANGDSKGTKRWLFFREYPRLEPGAEVFVPKREKKSDGATAAATQMWIGISTSLATLATMTITIVNLTRKN